jgi:hypothetical protein
MDARERLQAEFAQDIPALADWLGRELSMWTSPEPRNQNHEDAAEVNG